MKKIVFLTVAAITLLAVSVTITSAQAQKQNTAATQSSSSTGVKQSLAQDGLFQKEIITTRDPIPYPSIREADIIWSKRIWRTIDLREKLNFSLYYPTKDMALRRSLVQTLVDAIRSVVNSSS